MMAITGIVVIVCVMACVAMTGAAWHRLRLRNEVSARQRVHPPAHWLASPTACGRLHRRLRSAVAVLHLTVPLPNRRRWRRAPDPSALQSLAHEIECQAVAIDRDLMVADRMRGLHAVQARLALATQVSTVESLAHRVAAAARAAQHVPGVQPTPEALAAVAQRLDALDEARAELARLEAQTTTAPSGSMPRIFTAPPPG